MRNILACYGVTIQRRYHTDSVKCRSVYLKISSVMTHDGGLDDRSK